VRTFFSLSIPPSCALAIEHWRQLNWPLLTHCVPTANYHLTLVFTGEISVAELGALHDVASEIDLPAFDLDMNALGFWQKSGIFWLGSSVVPAPLEVLVTRLNKACMQAGVSVTSREFVPHITLARRCAELPQPPLIEPGFSFAVTEFSLMESVNTRQGVVYKDLFRLELGV